MYFRYKNWTLGLNRDANGKVVADGFTVDKCAAGCTIYTVFYIVITKLEGECARDHG